MVKEALLIARDNGLFTDIDKHTFGFVFFAVPQPLAYGMNRTRLEQITKNISFAFSGNYTNELVQSLYPSPCFQKSQAELFAHDLVRYQYHRITVHEKKPTKVDNIPFVTETVSYWSHISSCPQFSRTVTQNTDYCR